MIAVPTICEYKQAALLPVWHIAVFRQALETDSNLSVILVS